MVVTERWPFEQKLVDLQELRVRTRVWQFIFVRTPVNLKKKQQILQKFTTRNHKSYKISPLLPLLPLKDVR